MSDGMKITEVPEAREITKDTPEIAEAQADLNKATFEAPSKVEEGDIQEAEKVQEAFVESVPLAQAAEASPASSATEGTVPPPETPLAAQEDLDLGRPAENQSEVDQKAAAEVKSVTAEISTAAPTITLEGAPEAGKVTIDRAVVAEAAGDQGDVKIDTVPLPEKPAVADQGSVKIDTVPLPEKPAAAGEVSSSRESIGTWPTPEVPVGEVERVDPAAIIDSNDGTSTVGIIDSNDGVSAEAIIDSNDSPSAVAGGREAIGTWPTPETPEAIIDSDDDSSDLPQKPSQDDYPPVQVGEDDDGNPIFAENENYDAAMAAYDAKMKEASQEGIENNRPNDLTSTLAAGESREITVTTWEEGEDGTMVKVEKTVTLTKEEAESLLAKMDNQLDYADIQESREDTELTYHLEEGSLVVGEAAFQELPSDGSQFLRDITFDQEKYNILKNKLAHYNGIKSKITDQINELENIYQNWSGDVVQDFAVDFAEKQTDGTYQMVTKVIPLTKISIISYIASMKATKDQVNREAVPIRNEMKEMDPEDSAEDQERQALQNMKSTFADQKNKEAQEQADAAKDQEP